MLNEAEKLLIGRTTETAVSFKKNLIEFTCHYIKRVDFRRCIQESKFRTAQISQLDSRVSHNAKRAITLNGP